MNVKLGRAKQDARVMVAQGDFPGALRIFDGLLAAAPLDHEVRFRIGDLLARAGLHDQAAEVYRAVAVHDIRSGHPLPALVACHALSDMGKPADDILAMLARTYASDSPQLARFAVRPSPVDPETEIKMPPAKTGEPFTALASRAQARALDLSVFVQYQEQYHPLPFFSELGTDALLAVCKTLTVRRMSHGDLVMQQGEPGNALFLIAAGQVRVFARGIGGVDKELARLFENSLFGEMALLTDQPRGASVAVVGEADVIEVSREALARVVAQLPALHEVLDRFARERLIKNLLATSPLFKPFTKPQQADLLKHFEGVQVGAGATVIEEGAAGRGLFIVVQGQLQVVAASGTPTAVVLGRLGTGDVFGEMSLLANAPTSAAVQAVSACTMLFLARTFFDRLVAAVPEIGDYFQVVAAQRAHANTQLLNTRPEAPDPLDDITIDLLL